MSASLNPIIPKGSLILITGATGFVGASVAKEALRLGYRVRAITRDAINAAPVAARFEEEFGKDKFETVEIRNPTAPNAYNAALQGVSGVIHVATDTSMSADTDAVVKGVVEATVGLLKQAAQVPSVKAAVVTSSRIAAFVPTYGQDIKPTLDDWFDPIVDLAYSLSYDDPFKATATYAASKVRGEREAWAYINQSKPFHFAAVLPDAVLGPHIGTGFGSTHGWTNQFYNGDTESFMVQFFNPASWVVDCRDVATLHLAALLDPEANGKRIWAAAHPYTVNELLGIWRKAHPENKKLPADLDFPPNPKIELQGNEFSEKLLQKWAGRSFYPKEETFLVNLHDA